ncbi:hypothetical protein IWW56_002679 [Coemansia sp. RSA 2131]|nr:hypothetical protein IWW56_002679 [Coemansia sp. RSA 2131]
MVMSTLLHLHEHIYIDFVHVGNVGETAQDMLVVFTLAEFEEYLQHKQVQHILTVPYHPQSDVAKAAVKKFKTSLQWCWQDNKGMPGWTQYLPQIIAVYAVTQAKSVSNMPAAVSFGPDTVWPGKAFTVQATDSTEQTEQAICQSVDQQVLEHHTMVQNQANAQAN